MILQNDTPKNDDEVDNIVPTIKYFSFGEADEDN